MLSKIHTKQYDLIVDYMHALDAIEWLASFAEVSISDVDLGPFVSKEELLKSIK